MPIFNFFKEYIDMYQRQTKIVGKLPRVSITLSQDAIDFYKQKAEYMGVTTSNMASMMLKGGLSWFRPEMVLDEMKTRMRIEKGEGKSSRISISLSQEVLDFYKQHAKVIGLSTSNLMNMVLKGGVSWFRPEMLMSPRVKAKKVSQRAKKKRIK